MILNKIFRCVASFGFKMIKFASGFKSTVYDYSAYLWQVWITLLEGLCSKTHSSRMEILEETSSTWTFITWVKPLIKHSELLVFQQWIEFDHYSDLHCMCIQYCLLKVTGLLMLKNMTMSPWIVYHNKA